MQRGWILTVCLTLAGLFASAHQAIACLQQPTNPPDVTIAGEACIDPWLTVTLHDYSTFAASSDYCGCALNLPLAVGTVVGADIVETATGMPISAFQFNPDGDTAFGNGSTAWQGFSGFVSSVVGQISVDLVFRVVPSQEIPCATFPAQLADAVSNPPGGVIVGTGGTDPAGVPNHHVGVSRAGKVTIAEPGLICGTKFLDSNLDGERDAGEPGLGGWQILLTNAAGATRTVTTDATGKYCFEDLGFGAYTVQEVAQTGWLQTAPPGGAHEVVLSSGETLKLNFGNGCCGEGPQPDLEQSLNTGFDQSTSTLIPAGQLDDNWMVVHDDGGGVVPRLANVVNDGPLPAPLAGSRWITAVASGTEFGRPIVAPSFYEYQYCFCLAPGFSEPALEFDVSADDTVDMIDLNGGLLFVGPGGEFTGPPLHVTGDPDYFREGQNCLTVRVRDDFRVATGFTLTGTVSARGGFCCQERLSRVLDLKSSARP